MRWGLLACRSRSCCTFKGDSPNALASAGRITVGQSRPRRRTTSCCALGTRRPSSARTQHRRNRSSPFRLAPMLLVGTLLLRRSVRSACVAQLEPQLEFSACLLLFFLIDPAPAGDAEEAVEGSSRRLELLPGLVRPCSVLWVFCEVK